VGAWIEIIDTEWFPKKQQVALCVGAWIEISLSSSSYNTGKKVALCVGAWIEMRIKEYSNAYSFVALCVGAWIEMTSSPYKAAISQCRPLRGGVD